MTEAELLDAYQAEILALEESGAGVGPFVFSPNEAVMLLGLLQLALKHPNVSTQSPTVDAFGRGLAYEIQRRLSKGGEAIAEVCKRGWETNDNVNYQSLSYPAK